MVKDELNKIIKDAEHGDVMTQANLTFKYRNGIGVIENHKPALQWCTIAAEQGHADAEYYRGMAYFIGEEVPRDSRTAAKWYTSKHLS